MIKEKTLIVYATPDGKQFESEDDAWDHCRYLELRDFFRGLGNVADEGKFAEYICDNWMVFKEIVERHS